MDREPDHARAPGEPEPPASPRRFGELRREVLRLERAVRRSRDDMLRRAVRHGRTEREALDLMTHAIASAHADLCRGTSPTSWYDRLVALLDAQTRSRAGRV